MSNRHTNVSNSKKIEHLVALYCAQVPQKEENKVMMELCNKFNLKIIKIGFQVAKYKFLLGKKGDKDCTFENIKIFQKYYNYSKDKLLNIISNKFSNKVNVSSLEKLDKYNFNEMTITECIINGNKFHTRSLYVLQNKIYYLISKRKDVIEGTILDLKKGKKKGMIYLSKLDLSIPKSDCNESIIEIIYQCQNNNIKLELELMSIEGNILKLSL